MHLGSQYGGVELPQNVNYKMTKYQRPTKRHQATTKRLPSNYQVTTIYQATSKQLITKNKNLPSKYPKFVTVSAPL